MSLGLPLHLPFMALKPTSILQVLYMDGLKDRRTGNDDEVDERNDGDMGIIRTRGRYGDKDDQEVEGQDLSVGGEINFGHRDGVRFILFSFC